MQSLWSLRSQRGLTRSQVVDVQRGRDGRRFEDLLQKVRQSDLETDLISYGILINACEKGNDWQQAMGLLERMSKHGIFPDELSYNCAIRALRSCSGWPCASSSLYHMKTRSVQPSQASYNALISTCGWQEAMTLGWMKTVDEAITHNIPLAAQGFNSAMGPSTPWQRSIGLVKELPRKQVQVDRITYNSISQALPDVDISRWPTALELLSISMQRTLRPGGAAFCVTVTACSKDFAAWQFTLALLGTAETSALLDLRIFTTALSAVHWTIALCLFREMKQKITPDVVCYNSLIGACEQGSAWQVALELYREARSGSADRTGHANEMTFNMASSACQRCSRWEMALEIFQGLGAHALEANLVSWNTAMISCQRGHWFFAFHLLNTMALVPDEISSSSSITCCARANQWTTRRPPRLSPVTFNAALAAFDSFQWRWPLHLLQAMKSLGTRPDLISHSCTAIATAVVKWPLAASLLEGVMGAAKQTNQVM
eukprot:g13521.t1